MKRIRMTSGMLILETLAYAKAEAKSDGFVVFYDGEISGWTKTLNQPGDWMPGCVACEIGTAEMHVACGGDDMAGAERWQPATDWAAKQFAGGAQ